MHGFHGNLYLYFFFHIYEKNMNKKTICNNVAFGYYGFFLCMYFVAICFCNNVAFGYYMV